MIMIATAITRTQGMLIEIEMGSRAIGASCAKVVPATLSEVEVSRQPPASEACDSPGMGC